MEKPNNPYTKYIQNDKRGKKISVLWSVFEGDWEDLTTSQIAEVLNVAPGTIQNCLRRIRAETGYTVPHAARRRPDDYDG